MKKLGFATLVASGLTAAVFGLATQAEAAAGDLSAAPVASTISTGIDHLGWINDIQHDVNVPNVDNSVRHSGR